MSRNDGSKDDLLLYTNNFIANIFITPIKISDDSPTGSTFDHTNKIFIPNSEITRYFLRTSYRQTQIGVTDEQFIDGIQPIMLENNIEKVTMLKKAVKEAYEKAVQDAVQKVEEKQQQQQLRSAEEKREALRRENEELACARANLPRSPNTAPLSSASTSDVGVVDSVSDPSNKTSSQQGRPIVPPLLISAIASPFPASIHIATSDSKSSRSLSNRGDNTPDYFTQLEEVKKEWVSRITTLADARRPPAASAKVNLRTTQLDSIERTSRTILVNAGANFLLQEVQRIVRESDIHVHSNRNSGWQCAGAWFALVVGTCVAGLGLLLLISPRFRDTLCHDTATEGDVGRAYGLFREKVRQIKKAHTGALPPGDLAPTPRQRN